MKSQRVRDVVCLATLIGLWLLVSSMDYIDQMGVQ